MHLGLALIVGIVRFRSCSIDIKPDLNRWINFLNNLVDYHVLAFVHPNTIKLKEEPEEQQRCLSSIKADTAAQLVSTVAFQWLQWMNGSIDKTQSITATW